MDGIIDRITGLRGTMYNYYHPLMKAGSVKPFVHMMLFTSLVMYSTSYMARDYNRLKEKHVREHKAVLEYNEKYGIVDDGH